MIIAETGRRTRSSILQIGARAVARSVWQTHTVMAFDIELSGSRIQPLAPCAFVGSRLASIIKRTKTEAARTQEAGTEVEVPAESR